MTANSSSKRAIRSRMTQTGEKYTKSRRALLASGGSDGGERTPSVASAWSGDPLGWFTDQACNAIPLAQDEARMLGRSNVGPEHLLLAIARAGNVQRLLAHRSIDAGAIHAELPDVQSLPVASEAARRARGMPRVPALVALLGCLGLLVAGCGGGSGSPSVARLGSTAASASSGDGSAALTQQQETAIYVAYVACLNKHGVEVQAARTGGLVWEAAPGLPGPGSPQAAAAERDCKSVLPKGGLPSRPTAAQNARALAQLLRYARVHPRAWRPELPRSDLAGTEDQPLEWDRPQLAAVPGCTEELPEPEPDARRSALIDGNERAPALLLIRRCDNDRVATTCRSRSRA